MEEVRRYSGRRRRLGRHGIGCWGRAEKWGRIGNIPNGCRFDVVFDA